MAGYQYLLFTSLLAAAGVLGQPETGASSCSRQTSRDVRAVLDTYVFHPLGVNHSTLPEECLLRLDSDLFHAHEAHKSIAPRTGYHKCDYCNKTFRSEFYLDRHMDNKHMGLIPAHSHFCIADLAPLLGLRARGAADARGRAAAAMQLDSKCSAAILEKLNYQCAAIARSCFSGEVEGKNVQKEFISLVCSKLACRRGQLEGVAAGFGADDGEGSILGLILTILQILVVGIIVIGLAFYVWVSYPTWFRGSAYNSRFRERSAFSRQFKAFFKFGKSH